MIVVFHGEDQPALREKLLQFRHQYPSTRFWDRELAELYRFLIAPSLLVCGQEKELVVVEDPPLKEITQEMLKQWSGGVQDVALVFSRRLNPGELAVLGKVQLLTFFPKIPRSVFPFLDALAARQKSVVLRHAHRLLREGTDVDHLLRMIGWQMNALVRVKEGTFSGLKPYTIEKLKKVTGLWDAARLKRAFSELLHEDLRRKKGKKRPLDLLINRLVR